MAFAVVGSLTSPTISSADPIISSPSRCLSGDILTLASVSSAQNILVNSQNHLSTLSSPQQIKDQSFGDTSLMSPLLSPPDQLSLSPSQLGPLSPQSPIPLPPSSPSNGQNESWDTETEDRSGKLSFTEMGIGSIFYYPDDVAGPSRSSQDGSSWSPDSNQAKQGRTILF